MSLPTGLRSERAGHGRGWLAVTVRRVETLFTNDRGSRPAISETIRVGQLATVRTGEITMMRHHGDRRLVKQLKACSVLSDRCRLVCAVGRI